MSPKSASNKQWKFHDERDSLIAEAHARPSQNITSPAEILHVAFRADDEIYSRFFDQLDMDATQVGKRHISGKIKDCSIKLERHTEFMSCTIFQDSLGERKPRELSAILSETFPMEKVEILVLLKLDLLRTAREMLKTLSIDQRIYGGRIRDGIDVRSTFIPDENGFIRFALHGKNLTSDEMGRRLQRLMEMETYRTMSLLGLPQARKVSAELSQIERELDTLTISLRENATSSQEEDEALFGKLSGLLEQTNIIATETRYRFSASRAYFALFTQRVESLEEEKVGDVQTMSGFLKSRLDPAMATIESTAKRQETLNDDLSRALVLLRTRIELNLNKGNQALLKSMDKRHDQQLKISRTVEGLSVVAITYYAVGLVSYLLKALAKQPWMPFSDTMLTAVSIPFVLAFVWISLKRVRRAWEERKP